MSLTGSIIAGAGLAGSVVGAVGSSKAASAQENAANNAAALQHQDAQAALDFQKGQYQNSLKMLNPYLQTGYGALGLLRTGLGIGGQMPQGFDPFASNTNSVPSGGFNTPNIGSLADLRRQLNGGGAGGQFRPMQAFNGQVPMSNAASLAPGSDFGVNPAFDPNDPGQNGSVQNGGFGPAQFAGDPNDPSQIAFPGNPDAHNFGGFINASTNIGGTAQVPRMDGTDAQGNPNISFGSLLTPFNEKFSAPTVTDDPGYQFRLNQGINALQNSAASRGNLLTGGTAKSLNDYAQGSASQEYSNAYNRALNEYLNRYNIFTGNQTNQFNKLAAISGMGQTSTNELVNAGLTTGGQVGNTLLTSGQQIGNDLQAAGAARGSGYAGITNAITGGLSNLSNLALLSKIMG